MSDGKVHHTASDVQTEAGEVIVSGPDGVAVSLTAEAAAETGARLINAAAEAHCDDLMEEARARKRQRSR